MAAVKVTCIENNAVTLKLYAFKIKTTLDYTVKFTFSNSITFKTPKIIINWQHCISTMRNSWERAKEEVVVIVRVTNQCG